MGVKEEIKKLATGEGFSHVGVSAIDEVEKLDIPSYFGVLPPRQIFPEARSLVIMGTPLRDEAMNTSISIPGDKLYYNFYYEITEARAWRVLRLLKEERGISGVATHKVPMKPAAMLAGLGFIGRNSLVITPDSGPHVRFVAMLLDEEIELDAPFTDDLCEQEPRCKKEALCVKSCPYDAIAPGPARGVPPGEKVSLANCVVFHVFDEEIADPWKKHIRQVSGRGFMECTICSNACPYGKRAKIRPK
jgi:epoxyqueuosine reductase